MVNRPSVPEIITVNSEELQSQIRDLLPSQNGFGSELQASNVITPIIDLTRTAEGSGLSSTLQQAIAFGSQTAFNAANSTAVVVNTTGFFRVFGVCAIRVGGTENRFDMSDGISTKVVWKAQAGVSGGSDQQNYIQFDFVVFCAPGESLSAVSTNAGNIMSGSVRQIATGDGTLIQPNGYPL